VNQWEEGEACHTFSLLVEIQVHFVTYDYNKTQDRTGIGKKVNSGCVAQKVYPPLYI
jgi:hypothetical protein